MAHSEELAPGLMSNRNRLKWKAEYLARALIESDRIEEATAEQFKRIVKLTCLDGAFTDEFRSEALRRLHDNRLTQKEIARLLFSGDGELASKVLTYMTARPSTAVEVANYCRQVADWQGPDYDETIVGNPSDPRFSISATVTIAGRSIKSAAVIGATRKKARQQALARLLSELLDESNVKDPAGEPGGRKVWRTSLADPRRLNRS